MKRSGRTRKEGGEGGDGREAGEGGGLRRDGKDGRPLPCARVHTPARDEKRECPRDEERGIAEGEKLRFTDRGTVTKRERSLRERRKNLRRKEVGTSGDSARLPLSIQASLHVSFHLFLFSPFEIERINMREMRGKWKRARRPGGMKTKVNSFEHNR